MKKLIFLLIFLFIAIWLGLQIKTDPGYTLIAWHGWSIETPAWFAALILLIAFALLYALIRLGKFISHVPQRLCRLSLRRKAAKAQHLTNRGLTEFIEGYWKKAEKHLLQSASNSETPLINYLVAAKVAQERGDYRQRDKYLRQAHTAVPNAEVAIGLTQAQLQLHEKQNEQALATLKRLQEIVPHHPYVTKLLNNVYLELADWQNLYKLLPEIRKRKVLTSEKLQLLETKLYQALLSTRDLSAKTLQTCWQQIPKTFRKQPDILALYVKKLLALHADDAAAALLREVIKTTWDKQLIRLYGLSKTTDVAKQLTTVESWLQQQPNNYVILLTAGRLCLRNKLWGKARSYLETSANITGLAETYYELAQLLEGQNELKQALKYYKLGLNAKLDQCQ